MSLLSRLAWLMVPRALRTPEAREQYELRQRAEPIMTAADELAHQSVSDVEARDRLQRHISDQAAARRAIELLAARRDSYIDDRAYRLLTAAADGDEVRPIDPTVRDHFLREEALGRMPLEEAFARLAELEPGLSELAASEPPVPTQSQRIRELVGLNARSGDPLLRSDLASSIVTQYVAIRGGRLRGNLNKPYFEDRRTGTFSGSFFGDVGRPRATN